MFVISLSLTMLVVGGWLGYSIGPNKAIVDTVAASLDGGKKPDGAPKPKAQPAALVRVDHITQSKVNPTKPLVGSLVEVKRSTISAEVPGKIVAMPVEEGSKVTGGKTVLAKIDDTWCNISVSRIKAEIEAIQADLDFQNAEMKRLSDLLPLDAVSKSEFDSTRAVIKRLKANLEEAVLRLKEENEKKNRLTIIAPFDGSVITKHAEIGERLNIGTQIVDIVSSGRIDARIMVPESMLHLLSVGQSITLTVLSLNEDYKGKVISINSYGDKASRTFPVKIALEDQQGRLKSGMSVKAYMPVAAESAELSVPKDAVLIEPDGSTVWVVKRADGALVSEPVPVNLKWRLRNIYCIEPVTDEGKKLLKPDATVVIEGAERLSPGIKVRIDQKDITIKPVTGMHRNGQQKVGN